MAATVPYRPFTCVGTPHPYVMMRHFWMRHHRIDSQNEDLQYYMVESRAATYRLFFRRGNTRRARLHALRDVFLSVIIDGDESRWGPNPSVPLWPLPEWPAPRPWPYEYLEQTLECPSERQPLRMLYIYIWLIMHPPVAGETIRNHLRRASRAFVRISAGMPRATRRSLKESFIIMFNILELW